MSNVIEFNKFKKSDVIELVFDENNEMNDTMESIKSALQKYNMYSSEVMDTIGNIIKS